jgi:hypothetical protein
MEYMVMEDDSSSENILQRDYEVAIKEGLLTLIQFVVTSVVIGTTREVQPALTDCF